ncbi:hypothetical protein K402DRAFT_401584 [Aulographum hederae CBS 113979]|uniref:Uncharacterized protein n=1 Tax=Aulographum hederae CBS 113979 TaxID=1176131 RepID=A0A6G1HA89_9PEZI|nr:hypothetical protein K402DRAFT_401584 [Aulographum hederae CBS 113979]
MRGLGPRPLKSKDFSIQEGGPVVEGMGMKVGGVASGKMESKPKREDVYESDGHRLHMHQKFRPVDPLRPEPAWQVTLDLARRGRLCSHALTGRGFIAVEVQQGSASLVNPNHARPAMSWSMKPTSFPAYDGTLELTSDVMRFGRAAHIQMRPGLKRATPRMRSDQRDSPARNRYQGAIHDILVKEII